MDLIRELKDVRFELNLRGYDCDAVDAFLAKVRAEVAEVQSQRETAQSRVTALEEQVAGGESDTEGTLRRTLVLAQRLADETVADARATANELVETATADANQSRTAAEAEADRLLSAANAEAATILEAAKGERSDASAEATRVAESAELEATRTRSIASDEAERLLAEAERSGAARVDALESTARNEIASMREPIREEIRQLEETRSRLLSDIGALEDHLGEERVRVRGAVEALRIGMSGSIDDLAKVAADDELLTPADRPTLTNATGDDVAVADDVDVAETVQRSATPAPSVEQLEERARTQAADAAAVVDTTPDDDVIDHRPAHAAPAHAAAAEAEAPAAPEVEEIASPEPEPIIDHGPATERMPVIDADAFPAPEVFPTSDDASVVDLDQAPSALFGTDVAADAAVVEATAQPVEEPEETGDGFLQRFTEAIDGLPLAD
jgi:DivIVA domain-containing protein